MKTLLDADPRLRGSGMTAQRARDRLVELLRQQGIASDAVLNTIRYTPRHIFVDEALASHAYDNNALPIGRGQTISQPYIVARMSEALLQKGRPKKVLEIGTGCGYQTAVLAQLAGQVYTIERIAALMQQAQTRLADLRLSNIRFRHGDGYLGWPEQAPFDAIIVTAAPPEIPPALLAQLVVGGIMVVPVGPAYGAQRLELVRRQTHGYVSHKLDDVAFVPLQSGVAV
jgi:protein-L-isoaspartate(D-aspartate) O-methyltransferase